MVGADGISGSALVEFALLVPILVALAIYTIDFGLLVFNKMDQLPDRSYLDVLMKNNTRAVAISARERQGIETLRDAVIEALSADFANAEIEIDAGNGRVLAYLGAHAEIYRQHFVDNRVIIRCSLPRHLLYHIQVPDVQVRFLDANGNPSA